MMLLAFTWSVPPEAKVVLVIAAVYGLLEAAKKIPAFTKILNGWMAVAFNIIFTALGLLLTIPAGQLYTINTLLLLLTTGAGAAGVHGTVKSLSKPTVLATVPPSTKVVNVPATLKPIDPVAIPVKPEVKK